MATAPAPLSGCIHSLVCGRCSEVAAPGELVTLAVRGELAAVCQRCFLLEEIGSLSAILPLDDHLRVSVEECLRALYEVVLARAQEAAEERLRHGP